MEINERQMRFEFSGYSTMLSDSENNKLIYDDCVKILNERSREISKRIKYELIDRLREDVDVDVQIGFEKGSVEWYGIVTVLDWAARLSGTISLAQFLERVIRRSIDNGVERNLPDFYQERPHTMDSTVRYMIENENLKSTPDRIPENIVQNDATSTNSLLTKTGDLFSSRQSLIAITLFNLILFFGGNIYNEVQIQSIEVRHQQAIDQIEKSEEKYELAKQELQTLENQVRFDVKNILSRLEYKYDTVVDNSIAGLKKLQNQNVELLNSRLSELNLSLSQIGQSINSADSTLSRLSENIKSKQSNLEIQNVKLQELNRSGFKIRVDNFWNYTDWYFRIFIILGTLSFIVSTVVIVIRIRT